MIDRLIVESVGFGVLIFVALTVAVPRPKPTPPPVEKPPVEVVSPQEAVAPPPSVPPIPPPPALSEEGEMELQVSRQEISVDELIMKAERIRTKLDGVARDERGKQ